ncbi:hypothetical protein BC943DRAFT_327176 [Umbelopsis sp. AD052]|nr:hypothetical protein BC943DRAFT_327176 [Umbelopsis sp. AD052]
MLCPMSISLLMFPVLLQTWTYIICHCLCSLRLSILQLFSSMALEKPSAPIHPKIEDYFLPFYQIGQPWPTDYKTFCHKFTLLGILLR